MLGVSTHSPPPTWLPWPLLRWTSQVRRRCNSPRFKNTYRLTEFLMCGFLTVNWDTVWRANTTAKFQVSTELNRNVGLLRLFPGITAATVSDRRKCPTYSVLQPLNSVSGTSSNLSLDINQFVVVTARKLLKSFQIERDVLFVMCDPV